MKWHDCALPAVYYDLCRHDDFEVTSRWWELKILPVCANHRAKILWEVPIPMDRDIVARRPDVFLQGKMNRHLYLIEMVVAWDSIQERRAEKQSKYVGTLQRKLAKMTRVSFIRLYKNQSVTVVPKSTWREAPNPLHLAKHISLQSFP